MEIIVLRMVRQRFWWGLVVVIVWGVELWLVVLGSIFFCLNCLFFISLNSTVRELVLVKIHVIYVC